MFLSVVRIVAPVQRESAGAGKLPADDPEAVVEPGSPPAAAGATLRVRVVEFDAAEPRFSAMLLG